MLVYVCLFMFVYVYVCVCVCFYREGGGGLLLGIGGVFFRVGRCLSKPPDLFRHVL